MENKAFNQLRVLGQLVAAKAAPVPAPEEVAQNWHGAAFEVLGTRCVVSAEDTRLIADLPATIPIPGVKQWVKGLANINGRVIAIADLSAFLSGGDRNANGKHALVISGRGINTGLAVEASYGGVRLSTEELRTDLTVAEELQPYVSGVFSTKHGDYALFDTTRLLTDADFVEASVITTN
jgi:twitching motility protein PilI